MGKKIVNILSYLLIGIMLLIVALSLFTKNDVSIFGYRYMNVLTGSMEPNIPVGSLIFVKEVGMEECSVGDVITYKTPMGTNLTHRIVEVTKNGNFITQGDANNARDLNEITEDMLVGKYVFQIKYIGRVFGFCRENIAFTIGAIAIVLFLPETIKKIKEIKDKKK